MSENPYQSGSDLPPDAPPPAAPAPSSCPQCGRPLAADARYCSYCGGRRWSGLVRNKGPFLPAFFKGLFGALIGGAGGLGATVLLVQHTPLFAAFLPGALAGIGCSQFSRRYSRALGAICGLLGLGLGLLAFYYSPLVSGWSNLFQQISYRKFYAVLIIVGGILAYQFGKGREFR